MWLFGAGGTSGADEAKKVGDEEVRTLREEAEELRLKLEALEAADYRDQLREACAATAAATQGVDAAGRPAAAPAAAAEPLAGAVEHYRMDDSSLEERELEAMYDFTSFAPGQVAMGVEPSATAPGQLGPEEAAAARRLRMVEAKLQEREAELSERMEEKERKLVAASRALQRSKGQVQQLNAQLGLKDIEGSRLQCQVSQLRGLLVDKERRLQEALDRQAATAAALTEARAAGASSSSRAPSEQADPMLDEAAEDCGPAGGVGSQQPQEPPVACVVPPADEEQLLQMSRIAEQLTEALEVAREGEDEARRDLSETAARLQAEQAARAQYERELEAARRQRDLEVAQLLSRLQQQEQQLAFERARAKEHEERASRAIIEDRLQQALAQKGKTQFFPHLEV